jgi:hypothetical protein
MLVQLSKRRDGAGLLRCIRSDESVTWQKQARHAVFFALHDLTHFAVESTLGFEYGFFGLIAQGWNIQDTSGKGARGALTDEALEVEHIVGALDAERGASSVWTADEFNAHLSLHAAPSGRQSRFLTAGQLADIRSRRAQLFAQWSQLPSGETLELIFPSPVARPQVITAPTGQESVSRKRHPRRDNATPHQNAPSLSPAPTPDSLPPAQSAADAGKQHR